MIGFVDWGLSQRKYYTVAFRLQAESANPLLSELVEGSAVLRVVLAI